MAVPETPAVPIKNESSFTKATESPSCAASPRKETERSTVMEHHALYEQIADFYMRLLELQLARYRNNKKGPALIPGTMLNAWKKIDGRITAAFESTVAISAISKAIAESQERIAEYMSLAKFPESGQMDFRVLLLLVLQKCRR